MLRDQVLEKVQEVSRQLEQEALFRQEAEAQKVLFEKEVKIGKQAMEGLKEQIMANDETIKNMQETMEIQRTNHQGQDQEVARKQGVQGLEKELKDRIEPNKAGLEVGKLQSDLEVVKFKVQEHQGDHLEDGSKGQQDLEGATERVGHLDVDYK